MGQGIPLVCRYVSNACSSGRCEECVGDGACECQSRSCRHNPKADSLQLKDRRRVFLFGAPGAGKRTLIQAVNKVRTETR